MSPTASPRAPMPTTAAPTRDDFLALLRVSTEKRTPVKIDQILHARLIGLGHGNPCGRCGGCGHYSFNQIDGTTCFGCRGSGFVAQPLTPELYARVQADVHSGKLEVYLAQVQARVAAKKAADTAADRVMAAWKAATQQFPHNWHLAVDGEQPHRDLSREFNQPMCDAYDKVNKLANALHAMPYRRKRCDTPEAHQALDDEIESTRTALLATTDDALRVIEAAVARAPAIMARHAPPAAAPHQATQAPDDSPSP